MKTSAISSFRACSFEFGSFLTFSNLRAAFAISPHSSRKSIKSSGVVSSPKPRSFIISSMYF